MKRETTTADSQTTPVPDNRPRAALRDVLLDNFRDEPDAVVLFRWTPEGTRVRRLSDIPDLADALHRASPGEMLEAGFFNQPFDIARHP